MVGGELLLKISAPSSYGLGGKCFEDLEEKDDLLNEIMNDEGVCRTAPSTGSVLVLYYLIKSLSYNVLATVLALK